ncbi:expressed unknown protein [Seminavis robusta]|uniref:Uncharacterized protein n=1 Tax=Seminavis robusta TaxID=568900 RepID=A0A9N8DWF9_9STRA|nr:expressed unknown protein [Seminavis robusta]|eukprot:Sro410_g137300.1 n/a (275) ;mRNA; f:2329-3367
MNVLLKDTEKGIKAQLRPVAEASKIKFETNELPSDDDVQTRNDQEAKEYFFNGGMDALEECIVRHGLRDSGCFVKLTTRSPKDVVVAKEIAKQAFRARREHGEFGHLAFEDIPDHSSRWAAFGEEMRQALKVRSDNHAGNWKLGLVVRRWDDRCQPHREFRAFAWNGKLTCVGQYFSLLRFESLQGAPCVGESRTRCTSHLSPSQGSRSFARQKMDLVICDKPYLVDINPFDGVGLGTMKASTGLFDWDRDRDIMTGRQPFQIRVQRLYTPYSG